MKFLNVKFYTATEFMKIVGGGLRKKMFEYLRDTLRLIPSAPIKISRGKGIVAYYPECAVNHLKRVMKERKKGLTFRAIKEKLEKQTDKVIAKSDYLKQQYDMTRPSNTVSSKALMMSDDPSIQIKKLKGSKQISHMELKIQNAKKGLKKDFIEWDGKSIKELNEIKQRINRVVTLEASVQVAKTLNKKAVKGKAIYLEGYTP